MSLFLRTHQDRLSEYTPENPYIILCLGDSTTAVGGKDSWPSQLEEVLNERGLGSSFSVMNKGAVLIDSAGVLSLLEENLDLYQPNMVIIMLGMNDAKNDVSQNSLYGLKVFLHRSRTYRLAEQFWPELFDPAPIDYGNPAKAYANSDTISNFNAISGILGERGIPLVVMQYPLRELSPLADLFDPKEDIIFVDNENLFKDALKEGDYEDYFVDRFAGDFGHCTRTGNRMIAENVADTITRNGGLG